MHDWVLLDMTIRGKRTSADWIDSELYVGPKPPLSAWEAYRVPLCALLVVLLGLVVVLLTGERLV